MLRQDIALLKLNNSRATERNPDARRIGTKCLHARYRPPAPPPKTNNASSPPRSSSSSLSLSPSLFQYPLSGYSLLIPSFLPSPIVLFPRFPARTREITARSVRTAAQGEGRRAIALYRPIYAIKLAERGNYDLNALEHFSRSAALASRDLHRPVRNFIRWTHGAPYRDLYDFPIHTRRYKSTAIRRSSVLIALLRSLSRALPSFIRLIYKAARSARL